MPTSLPTLRRIMLLLMALALTTYISLAQEPKRDAEQTDDVLRIRTELVQTDVMVFDRNGRFVDGLQPDQFELSLDGKSQPFSFFERVTAGSSTEARQLAAARRNLTPRAENRVGSSESQSSGRLIFFFLDDVHLGADSLARARVALKRFIDEQMTPTDQVAIVSTSGQIGFLQQLTDNRTVLREAIARLNFKQNAETYTGKTRISEYVASQIEDYANRELFYYLMESTKLEQQTGSGYRRGDHKLASTYSASPYLRNRLRQVQAQTRMATSETLAALRDLIDSSAGIAGRKLVIFLSDGFVIDTRKADASEMMHRVAQAAAHAGALVYAMDLRGTFTDSAIDASTNDAPDFSSRRAGVLFGETRARQEPLHILADETGGRAILNSNDIGAEITQAIRETSEYYVLAWRPESAEQRDPRTHLKITIKDHPELRVRLRSNFYSTPFAAQAVSEQSNRTKQTANASALQRAPEVEMLAALGSSVPLRGLPTALSAGYVNRPDSAELKVSMQIERAAFGFDSNQANQKALVDVIGAAVDDRGMIYSFKQLLTVTPDSGAGQPIIWHQQLKVRPGLYQVRVAVRERASGRTGSATQWIEIPEARAGEFALSSLFLGERKSEDAGGSGPRPVAVNVAHSFANSSILRFQTYVSQAARGPQGPDVWIRAQLFRDRQQTLSTALEKVPLTSDPAHLPYWAEIPLSRLAPGNYVLQVSAIDRISNASATQQINFTIR